MRLLQSTGVWIQDENFTVVCEQSKTYQTGYEGHTGNWSLDCFKRSFSSCEDQIKAYNALDWPPQSYVLLKEGTCPILQQNVPCDIFGPPGGDPNRTSFAFKANSNVPLYMKGCWSGSPWCSITFFSQWSEGVPTMACDEACSPLGCA